MKTMEESARNADAREKALKNLNSQTHDVVAAQDRVSKAQAAHDGIKVAANKEYEEKLDVFRQEWKENARVLEVELAKTLNSASSNLGTAKAELAKIEKRYTAARARLTKLLPPEDITMEPKTNGATDDRSHASVG